MTEPLKRSTVLRVITSPARAVSHASWLYPFKGIYYFCAHPFLWPLLRARLLPSALLSLFVLTNLFLWTYLPQVALLAIFHGRLAWLNATFLVLGEGAAIVSLLFEAFFVDETLVDVFDAVLINEGYTDLITTSRMLVSDGRDPVKQLGRPTMSAIYSPFSFRQIAEFIIFLPLNLIPVAGTPMFLVLTGYRAGPLQHWRYFKLLNFTKKERNAFIKKRQLRYTWFGTVALLLQLVPVLSMLFLLTTAAGSALWVAQLDGKRRALEARIEDESSERYADDPS
ncbi:MAG: hypothetical protein ASARMPREDX12_004777 [Alectoria sarmentosa]|nr:MAG: hypothetical protein ASARMPREDX12_004777 [Alectoria sarmentosa]